MGLANPLTREQLNRLVLVRHLYRRALQEAQGPMPFKAAALLSLHDGVELFLALACESAGRTLTKGTDFAGYWRLLYSPPSPITLSHETSMLRLNTARVLLKHHGMSLAPAEIDGFAQSVSDFYLDNTPLLWDKRFEDVSLVDLVADSEVQVQLRKCEVLVQAGTECMADISISFTMVTNAAKVREGHDPHYIWPLRYADESYLPPDTVRYLKDLENNIRDLREEVTVLAYQLDMGRLRTFRAKSYMVYQLMGIEGYQASTPKNPTATLHECRDCLDFVIDSALRIQQYYA